MFSPPLPITCTNKRTHMQREGNTRTHMQREGEKERERERKKEREKERESARASESERENVSMGECYTSSMHTSPLSHPARQPHVCLLIMSLYMCPYHVLICVLTCVHPANSPRQIKHNQTPNGRATTNPTPAHRIFPGRAFCGGRRISFRPLRHLGSADTFPAHTHHTHTHTHKHT
jgi:hypothetical protein